MHKIPFAILFCIERKISVIDYFAYADTCAHREPIFFQQPAYVDDLINPMPEVSTDAKIEVSLATRWGN